MSETGPLGVISEIFSSLQGEGLHLGERQIFIRFAGCPWRCRYCDTPASLTPEGHPALTVTDVVDRVRALEGERRHAAASLTGGEPLLQTDFLDALLPPLKTEGLRIYLETSGTHPHLLKRVVERCDVIAMDIKLPSAVAREFWTEHAEFLGLARERAFVKVVLTEATADWEMENVVKLLAASSPVPTLVLQPVTAVELLDVRLNPGERMDTPSATSERNVRPPSPARVMALWEWSRQRLPSVKLIPQMHPMWGVP
jgi:organic radical activating enzyme